MIDIKTIVYVVWENKELFYGDYICQYNDS